MERGLENIILVRKDKVITDINIRESDILKRRILGLNEDYDEVRFPDAISKAANMDSMTIIVYGVPLAYYRLNELIQCIKNNNAQDRIRFTGQNTRYRDIKISIKSVRDEVHSKEWRNLRAVIDNFIRGAAYNFSNPIDMDDIHLDIGESNISGQLYKGTGKQEKQEIICLQYIYDTSIGTNEVIDEISDILYKEHNKAFIWSQICGEIIIFIAPDIDEGINKQRVRGISKLLKHRIKAREINARKKKI